MMFCCLAISNIITVLLACSFLLMFFRCVTTVCTLIASEVAIEEFVFPDATCLMISISRGVMGARGLGGD